MKANELMIGDWVLEGGQYPHKVGGLDEQIDGMLPECYSPIPLTPEILEKNGFKQDKECPFVYETDDEDVIIDLYDPDPRSRLSKKDEYDKMVGIRLSPTPPYGFSYWGQSLIIRANYVHELQHALRLCGIKKEIVI